MYKLTDLLTSADRPIPPREAVTVIASPPGAPDRGRLGAHRSERRAYIESGASVELWVIPGSGHAGGLEAEPVQWVTRVTEFLAGVLGEMDQP